MATRKKAGRRRGTTARKRGARTGRKRSVRTERGPNITRLLRADVLTTGGAKRLGPTGLNGIEKLTGSQINTLIEVRRRLGRKPNCWLI